MKLHLIKGHVSSIYIVEYPDKLLMLDGCARPDVRTIHEFITTSLNRPISDLKLVVVTHMHPDHAGAAEYLRRLSGCKLAFANSVQKPWYAGVRGVFKHQTDVLLTNWLAMKKGKPARNLWSRRKLKFDFFVNDEQALPNFPDWQALHTPGHTNADLSLYHAKSQTIYLADLIIKTKGSYFSPVPVSYPNLYRASLDRVLALKAKQIYLAHSGEALLTEQDLQNLYASIPKKPLTALSSIRDRYLVKLDLTRLKRKL